MSLKGFKQREMITFALWKSVVVWCVNGKLETNKTGIKEASWETRDGPI